MDLVFIGVVVFLFVLAVFDLSVGVSNDAVNFLNSAIGAKVARFRTVLIIAAVGVFAGAAMSNGMMDVARHGIMQPQYYSFYEVMCVFLAVMVADVIILDVFNTLGMPTSTTVSMVFELLGGTFALAMLKLFNGATAADGALLTLGNLLNTEKAISVILGIFLSVAIAFVFGTLVQWIARNVFTFTYRYGGSTTDYTGRMGGRLSSSIKIGVFGGIATTCIVWFLLTGGLKGSSLMTDDVKEVVSQNTFAIIGGGMVAFSALMTLLSAFRLPVLKFIVMLGTFALAMAFAGNDLVNFVGVPLTGLDAFLDYTANGGGNADGFMMESLSGSAHTPTILLIMAGTVMVLSLIFSKKAQGVVKTSVDLSRQDEGDEMFGSSALARAIVRSTMGAASRIARVVPAPVGRWIDARFNTENVVLPEGAAFDLIRASVNLVLAALLVAIGTANKLPLSTTYVTFMVAMGTSLADRAWSRDSAVFRITGVLSVIGGWFITAAVAFILCYLVTLALYFGGSIVMVAAVAVAVALLIRSNIRYSHKKKEQAGDLVFQQLMRSHDKDERWQLLRQHVRQNALANIAFAAECYERCTENFFAEDYRKLRRVCSDVEDKREDHRRQRRREIIGLRRIAPTTAMERSTWFFVSTNATEQMLYCLKRMAEPCRDHIANKFSPLPPVYADNFTTLSTALATLYRRAAEMLRSGKWGECEALCSDAKQQQAHLAEFRKEVFDDLQKQGVQPGALTIYVNLLQESEEMLGAIRRALRGTMSFASQA